MDESSASRVVGLFQDGGFTMPFLGMCLFILWFAIGYRSILLRPRRGFQPTVVLNPSRITRTSTHWLDRAAKVTADAMRHGDLLLRERLEADLTPFVRSFNSTPISSKPSQPSLPCWGYSARLAG